jgi:hypothetical protein
MNFAYLTDTAITNQRLKEMYGTNVNKNLPNFRLVFANDQVEKRKGTFREYWGEVFLREVTGIKEVPKYPFFQDCWILERLVPNVLEDVEGDFTYEPVYRFPENVYPIWRAIEFFMFNIFNPKANLPRTQKEADYQEEERIAKEKKRTRDMIDTTSLETALNDGNAMSYTNTKGIDYRPSQQKG